MNHLQPDAAIARQRRFWRRFLRNRPAAIGLLVIIIYALLALFGPYLAPHDPTRLNFGKSYLPPAWVVNGLKAADVNFLLGTDSVGRDIFSRAIHGTRTALFTAGLAVPLAALLGTLVGLLSAYAGTRLTGLLERLVDVFQAFPQLLFVILFALIFRRSPFGQWGNGTVALGAGFALAAWAGAARLVRSAVLTLRGQPFVEAARALGAGKPRIILGHILPHCVGLLLVWMTFTMPRAILAEALVGFIGISMGQTVDGKDLSVYSWGGLFFEGRRAIHAFPHILLTPAIAITLLTAAFIFVGDGLRDALDPKGE